MTKYALITGTTSGIGKALAERFAQDKINLVLVSRNNQKLIKECVDEINGVFIPVYPSDGNMLAIDLKGVGIDPKVMADYLLERKIFTRQGAYTSNLFGEDYLRVSFSIPEEQVRVFVKEFELAVEALHQSLSLAQ